MNKVYIDNIWYPYNDDVNHLFDSSIFTITKNANESNIIVQSNFNRPIKLRGIKTVMLCMEPYIPEHIDEYDLVIMTHKEIKSPNTYYYPFGIMTMYIYNHIPYILNRPVKNIDFSHKKFCVFINSNLKAWQRVNFCQKLLNHPNLPKVDCCGKSLNNCDICPYTHSSPEFINFIRQYKFIICFENSDKDGYFTEKIINAFVGDTVPIYWCNKNAQKYFNEKSMVLIPEYTPENVNKAIEEIVTLQNNDELYKQKLLEPLFKNNSLPKEFELSEIQRNVSKFLNKKYSFIVPYRNREEHLQQFIQRFISFNLNENYSFYFVHQCDEELFNRGAMKNVGFLEASTINPDSLFIFNDIDMLPTYLGSIEYDTPLGTVRKPLGFNLENLGGICCFYKSDFEKVNGFPNYRGWGVEDVTILKRVQKANIPININKYNVNLGSNECQSLNHNRSETQNETLRQNTQLYQKELETGVNDNGLSSLNYEVLSKDEISKNMFMLNVKLNI